MADRVTEQRKVVESGQSAFNRSLPFSELGALRLLTPFMRSSLKYNECYVVSVEEAEKEIAAHGEKDGWSKEKMDASEPGAPAVQFWNA